MNPCSIVLFERKLLVAIAMLIFLAFPPAAFAQSDATAVAEQKEGKNGVHLGLGYPISNHGTHANQYTNVFSLNAAVGVSRAERGVAIAGVSSIVKENARGVQLAGFSNHFGNAVSGLTTAGFMNTYQEGRGVQVAGFANLARTHQSGLQLAGFLNRADEVRGVQVAGFLNKARLVKGAQLGIINVADSNDYPIGIINLVKGGEKSIGVSTDETLTTLVSFRSGGRVMYGILGVGYNLTSSADQYVLESGIGAHVLNKGAFRLNTEMVSIAMTNFKKGDYSRFSLRLLPAFRLANRLEIYAGPTFNYVSTNSEAGKEFSTRDIWRKTSGNQLHELNVGLMGGLNLILN